MDTKWKFLALYSAPSYLKIKPYKGVIEKMYRAGSYIPQKVSLKLLIELNLNFIIKVLPIKTYAPGTFSSIG